MSRDVHLRFRWWVPPLARGGMTAAAGAVQRMTLEEMKLYGGPLTSICRLHNAWKLARSTIVSHKYINNTDNTLVEGLWYLKNEMAASEVRLRLARLRRYSFTEGGGGFLWIWRVARRVRREGL